jgi:hypothetical protein
VFSGHVTGVLFGLSPALKLSNSNLGAALKDEGSAFGARIARSQLRTWLIGAQVFVSMVFLLCAALLIRGLVQSRTADQTLVPTLFVTSVQDGPLLKIQLVMSQLLAVFAGTLAGLALVTRRCRHLWGDGVLRQPAHS